MPTQIAVVTHVFGWRIHATFCGGTILISVGVSYGAPCMFGTSSTTNCRVAETRLKMMCRRYTRDQVDVFDQPGTTVSCSRGMYYFFPLHGTIASRPTRPWPNLIVEVPKTAFSHYFCHATLTFYSSQTNNRRSFFSEFREPPDQCC